MAIPLLALALAGCGAATSSLPTQRPVVADAGPEYRRAVDTLGQAEAVPGTLDQVWQALPAVYQELGLRVNEVDPRARRVGVRTQRLMRDAGSTRLSVYLDCGSGLTGPHADEYRVTLTAISTVVPTGAKPTVATAVLAEAVDPSGSASDRIGCTTTGRLEYAILTRLKQKLGGER